MPKYVIIITKARPDYKRPWASNTIRQFDTIEEVEEYKKEYEQDVLDDYYESTDPCDCDMTQLCECDCTCGCGCDNIMECEDRREEKDSHMCKEEKCDCECNCLHSKIDIWNGHEINEWVYSNSYMDMPAYSCKIVGVNYSGVKNEGVKNECVKNECVELLKRLEVCSDDSLERFSERVRDREDVYALRCKISGVVVLSSTSHLNGSEEYERKHAFDYWGEETTSRRQSALKCYDDDRRRADLILSCGMRGKRWMDIGTGAGGIMDLISKEMEISVAVEPMPGPRKALQEDGFVCVDFVKSVSHTDFDIVTSFHVVEHLLDPIGVLESARSKMKSGATLIVEVPHANDFLLSFIDCEAFKNFTLWSEHLILHTRESLRKLLSAAGFEQITIKGIQRYSIANHLMWLSQGKPGGHQKWAFFESPDLVAAYEHALSSVNHTDTLIAFAKAP